MYNPSPVNTRDIALPASLVELTEQIAENVHENWALGRIRDGWVYGPERDDEKRHHPCIVPYEELSEEEKDYDRRTAGETLKLILKLGFKITRD